MNEAQAHKTSQNSLQIVISQSDISLLKKEIDAAKETMNSFESKCQRIQKGSKV